MWFSLLVWIRIFDEHNQNTSNSTWMILFTACILDSNDENNKREKKVPPRFELGLQDSESWVLTITPWDHWFHSNPFPYEYYYNKHNNIKGPFNSQNSLLSNPTYPSPKTRSVASQSPYPNTVSTSAIGSQSMSSFPLDLHTNLLINRFQHSHPKWVWQLSLVC